MGSIAEVFGVALKLGLTWFTILIAEAALAALFRWKVSNPLLIAATAAAGLIAFPLIHPTWMMLK
jgi:chromate transporter